MYSTEEGNLVFARLDDGEEVFPKIHELIKKHKIDCAVVMNGVGMLRTFKLGFYMGAGQYLDKEVSEPVEIASFAGNISRHEDEPIIHIHSALAFRDKSLIGGHLMKGVVHNTLEMFLLRLSTKLRKEKDPKTGLLRLGPKE
jgi:predicted DNA-binding protein with PD1-like motif